MRQPCDFGSYGGGTCHRVQEAEIEPLPESVEAAELYGPFAYGDADLPDALVALGDEVRSVVPSCVGLSDSLVEEGVTFTVTATAGEVAALDAAQDADGEPHVEPIRSAKVLPFGHDAVDEERWRSSGRATAAADVRSTLSMPVLGTDRVVAGFNLYARADEAFVGHHDRLALILDAWPAGAVRNADLTFSTRELAQRAPALLREGVRWSMAVARVMTHHRLPEPAAADRLRSAAMRSGATLEQSVDLVIDLFAGPRV